MTSDCWLTSLYGDFISFSMILGILDSLHFQIVGCVYLGFDFIGLLRSSDSFIHYEISANDFSHYESFLNDHLTFYQQLKLLFLIVKLISFVHLQLLNSKTVSIYLLDIISLVITPKLVSYFSYVAYLEKNPMFFNMKKHYMYFY
jgi:hypothetical protein